MGALTAFLKMSLPIFRSLWGISPRNSWHKFRRSSAEQEQNSVSSYNNDNVSPNFIEDILSRL